MATGCAFGCGGNGGDVDDNAVELEIQVDNGGLGSEWIKEAGKRFTAANVNTVWGKDSKGNVKTGVTVSYNPTDGVNISEDAKTSTTAIYDLTNVSSLSSAVNGGWILEIDDIMTTAFDYRESEGKKVSVDDKISEDFKSRFTYQGKYYAAPSIEYYPGMAYDIDLFNAEGYYFAKEGSTNGVTFKSSILGKDFTFVKNTEAGLADKSCGPDGEFGTSDDGLPSSLYELIALCEKMKQDNVTPISFTGTYANYSNFMLSGLTAALQGYERAKANYTFDGTFEVVTGYEDEPLFPGVSGIKKPKTKTVKVTEQNGYYVSSAVEKYYAEAFLELAIQKDWISGNANINTGTTQTGAMYNFILSGVSYGGQTYERIGMHVDGSFWYNEANLEGYFDNWKDITGEGGALTGRNVAWMALPVNYSESVTAGNGKGQTMFDMWSSMLVINGNVKNNEAKMNAAKAFVQFLCSDSELSKFTSLTSMIKSLDYSLTSDDYNAMSGYGQRLWDLVRGNDSSKVVYFSADNETFKANSDLVAHGWQTNGAFSVKSDNSYYKYRMKNSSSTLAEIFGYQTITKDKWKSLYQGAGGSDAVTD